MIRWSDKLHKIVVPMMCIDLFIKYFVKQRIASMYEQVIHHLCVLCIVQKT